MKKIYLPILSLLCSSAAFGQSADPASDSSKTLNEVEITTTSNSNKAIIYQPASIAKLKETELKRGVGLFLDDAINQNVPGVFMEKRSISGGQQFNIRGYGNGSRGTSGVSSNFDGQGYKVYLNNIPITDAEGFTVMDDIDFNSLSNVEIIKGPAGTLYGLAIAGVVNLKTANAEPGHVSIEQDALVGSYGLARYTTQLKIGGVHSSVLVNYGKEMYDGFKIHGATHNASHKDFVNVFGLFQPNAKQTISTYFGYSNSYDQRSGELTLHQYDTMDYSGNPAYIKNDAHSNVISYRAGMSHTYKFSNTVSNTTTVFGSGVANNSSSAAGWTDKLPVNYGLRTTLDLNFKLSEKIGLSSVTGFEGQIQNAQTIGYGMVADSTNLAGYNIIGAMRSNQYTTSKTTSLFTEWTLSLPHHISVTAGLGWSTMAIELNDRFYVAANNKPNDTIPTRYAASYKNMVSPHIAVNKVFNEHISAYASYSTGYKAPVSSYFFIPTTGQVNTNLKPESGNQIEVGSKGILMHSKLTYQVALFNAVFSNKMTTVAVPLNGTTTAYTYVVNGGRQTDMGLEAQAQYLVYSARSGVVRGVSPFANFCYSDFKYNDFKFQTLSTDKKSAVVMDYSNNPVAGVPPITFNAGVDLQFGAGIYANVVYSYRDGMPITSDDQNHTSSYALLNAKLGIKQHFLKRFDVDAYVGANNMTGTQYYYMVFQNQLPDAYLAAPDEINYYGGISLRYNF